MCFYLLLVEEDHVDTTNQQYFSYTITGPPVKVKSSEITCSCELLPSALEPLGEHWYAAWLGLELYPSDWLRIF
jgi:hypothetical protein